MMGKLFHLGIVNFHIIFADIEKSDTSSFNEDFRYHVSKMKSMYFIFLTIMLMLKND